MSRRARIGLVVLLVALTWGCYALRRAVIRGFFVDGAATAGPGLYPDPGPMMGPATAVRVVLIDGLSRDHASTLDVLSGACARGLDFVVDVGFPTVSLPVQHVLWTGLTQQQAGVLYRLGRLDPAPTNALGARVAGSIAVGESHRDIVHSFGFSHTEPAAEREEIEEPGSSWRTSEFMAVASAAVASPAPLGFVHVLRVDEAGHGFGGASPEYARAASEADAMLAGLIAADPSPGTTRWFVVADHGHRPAGGHGDAEPEIRMVRACIFGDVQPAAPIDTPVHLVDLHRALAEAVGVAPLPEATGRTLAFAWAHPEPDATLPRAAPVDLVVAAGLCVVAALGAHRALGRGVWIAAVWPLLCWLGVVLLHGPITLSNPVVYPPVGRDVLLASLGGLAMLAVGLRWLCGRIQAWRAALGLVLPAVGVWTATAWVCGVPAVLAGGAPPLLPRLSALCSVLAIVLTGAFAVTAVVLLVLVVRRSGQSRHVGSDE